MWEVLAGIACVKKWKASNSQKNETESNGTPEPVDVPVKELPKVSIQLNKRVNPEEILPSAGNIKTLTINGIDYNFHYCPAGKFLMGSPVDEPGRGDDEIQREVSLKCGFWLLETAVTQEMWKSVMGENPSVFEGPQFPVNNISWDDAQRFIQRLNGSAPLGIIFRLPTEAEWEKACRADSESAYSWGADWSDSKARGNCAYKEGPARVKGYPPNALGLYDMHGNVWEWCSDWYENYPAGTVVDPKGTLKSFRVLRGGSWGSAPIYCRCATRSYVDPAGRYSFCGFRLAFSSME